MDTRTVLRDFIGKEFMSAHDAAYPEDDDKLVETGIIDSLGMMRLVGFIRHNFDVSVPGEDLTMSNFSSLRTIVDYVERRRSAS